jgi:hypothetical protein
MAFSAITILVLFVDSFGEDSCLPLRCAVSRHAVLTRFIFAWFLALIMESRLLSLSACSSGSLFSRLAVFVFRFSSCFDARPTFLFGALLSVVCECRPVELR